MSVADWLVLRLVFAQVTSWLPFPVRGCSSTEFRWAAHLKQAPVLVSGVLSLEVLAGQGQRNELFALIRNICVHGRGFDWGPLWCQSYVMYIELCQHSVHTSSIIYHMFDCQRLFYWLFRIKYLNNTRHRRFVPQASQPLARQFLFTNILVLANQPDTSFANNCAGIGLAVSD